MKTLQRALLSTFKPAATRRTDRHRRERAEAKRLATERKIEIEKLPGGGFNVWPPAGGEATDPFEGDHYCSDWPEVLEMVRTYSGLVDVTPVRLVIEKARARLDAVVPASRGAHWRDASRMLAIAEDAIPHSHALAERHLAIAEGYVAKAEAGADTAQDIATFPLVE